MLHGGCEFGLCEVTKHWNFINSMRWSDCIYIWDPIIDEGSEVVSIKAKWDIPILHTVTRKREIYICSSETENLCLEPSRSVAVIFRQVKLGKYREKSC